MQVILRVDDIGLVPPDKTNDVGLEYFQRWRTALHTEDIPIYLGLIPTTVTSSELQQFKDLLNPNEELAVHGWDHVRGAGVTRAQMLRSRQEFSKYAWCRSYIPPFNAYGDHTIMDWNETRTPGELNVFFAGFRGEHYIGPDQPYMYEDTLVLPTHRFIYDRAPALLQQLPQWESLQCPLVVTLHATWDQPNSILGDLHDYLKPHLVPVDAVPAHMKKMQLSAKALTGAHYMAYSMVVPHVTLADEILDFGARYSVLPCQMLLRGGIVTAVDRDARLPEYQEKLAANYGIRPPTTVQWDGLTPRADLGGKHMITACWALQHNLEEGQIETISRNLAALLRPNGKLIVVGSFSPTESFTQMDRADPQIVLNRADHLSRIIVPSCCHLEELRPFRYEHGVAEARECTESEANAVCYVLRKRATE